MKSILVALTLSLGLFSLVAPAFADSDTMTDGVIRKINMDTGKVTIKHGEIVNLDMPPMSMVFTAKDASMLEALAKGDKVKFVATEENGKMFVTEIQVAE